MAHTAERGESGNEMRDKNHIGQKPTTRLLGTGRPSCSGTEVTRRARFTQIPYWFRVIFAAGRPFDGSSSQDEFISSHLPVSLLQNVVTRNGMLKSTQRWLLFTYEKGRFTPLSKPFKTRKRQRRRARNVPSGSAKPSGSDSPI